MSDIIDTLSDCVNVSAWMKGMQLRCQEAGKTYNMPFCEQESQLEIMHLAKLEHSWQQ